MRHRRQRHHMSKDPRSIHIRVFICIDCCNKLVMTKTRHTTAPGHIKTAYCPFCKKRTVWLQLE